METKPLLFAIIGFFIGGLLVSTVASTQYRGDDTHQSTSHSSMEYMSMNDMTAELEGKTGDEFDKAFIEHMIVHHEGAVEMAKLSTNNARRQEIKNLSEYIISAQEKEIQTMKEWQAEWKLDPKASAD